jgi:hypothetical protein
MTARTTPRGYMRFCRSSCRLVPPPAIPGPFVHFRPLYELYGNSMASDVVAGLSISLGASTAKLNAFADCSPDKYKVATQRFFDTHGFKSYINRSMVSISLLRPSQRLYPGLHHPLSSCHLRSCPSSTPAIPSVRLTTSSTPLCRLSVPRPAARSASVRVYAGSRSSFTRRLRLNQLGHHRADAEVRACPSSYHRSLSSLVDLAFHM